jgi:hypothetical protein
VDDSVHSITQGRDAPSDISWGERQPGASMTGGLPTALRYLLLGLLRHHRPTTSNDKDALS